MKEKQYIRFIELSGISITRKEYEGIKLFMEIEDLIQETEKAFKTLKDIIGDYSVREEEAKTETKIIMLVNKWTSPYIACIELVKRIETNETFIKNICKASGTTLVKIGYKTRAKEVRELMQEQANK